MNSFFASYVCIAVGYIHHLHEREQSFVKETEELRREILALKERQ